MTAARCRFPAAPLIAAARTPERIGVTKTTWDRWHRPGACVGGRIRADRMACALGLHPSSIWGDLWWHQAEQEAS